MAGQIEQTEGQGIVSYVKNVTLSNQGSSLHNLRFNTLV